MAVNARARVSDSLVHCWANYALRRALKQGNLHSKVVKNMQIGGKVSEHVWVCAWGAKKLLHISRGPMALVRLPPRDVCIKSWVQPNPSSFGPAIFLSFLLPLSSLKILRKHRSSSFFVRIFIRLSDFVGPAHGCSWCSFL